MLIGLYLGLGGEGEGRIAVEGSMAFIPVLVGDLGGGGGEARDWIAWSKIACWCWAGVGFY